MTGWIRRLDLDIPGSDIRVPGCPAKRRGSADGAAERLVHTASNLSVATVSIVVKRIGIVIN